MSSDVIRRGGSPWSRFQYHRSFEAQVLEISSKLNAYFSNLGLLPYREFFPPSSGSSRALLDELRRGFSCRIWRNRSLVPSDENAAPPAWPADARIRLPAAAVSAANTLDLRDVLNTRSPLRGFLHCMCLVETETAQQVYTPLVGGWVAASAEERFADREVKGVFSWRKLPDEAQREVQFAYLLRLLIDACWWQATDNDRAAPDRDTTTDTSRFVSFLVEDLPLFPVETLRLLEDMGEASQHFDLEGQAFKHSLGKCGCSRFASRPDLAKSHLLIPTTRLRSYLVEQHNARKRSSASAVVRAVFNGKPSTQALLAVEQVRESIRASLLPRPPHKRLPSRVLDPAADVSPPQAKRSRTSHHSSPSYLPSSLRRSPSPPNSASPAPLRNSANRHPSTAAATPGFIIADLSS